MPFSLSKEKIAKAAEEIANQLQVVEHIKALQVAQKELADSIKLQGDRIRNIETELRALKAETLFQAIKETQSIVNSVQGGLNQRMETLAVQVALIQQQPDTKHIEAGQASPLHQAQLGLPHSTGDGQ